LIEDAQSHRYLSRIAREYGADEAMVVTIIYEHEARRRSYELIADAFGPGNSSKTI
jgi:hypothetical protein